MAILFAEGFDIYPVRNNIMDKAYLRLDLLKTLLCYGADVTRVVDDVKFIEANLFPDTQDEDEIPF